MNIAGHEAADRAAFFVTVPSSDSARLRAYTPNQYPVLDATGFPRYLTNELKSVGTSVSSVMDVIASLEARIKALGG